MNANLPEMLEIMLPPFVECLILVGIHSYLGIHVIKRGVIFVDLAIAQIAALGLTVGFLFHVLPDSTLAYWIALSFTLAGAALFSLFRFEDGRVPQEAIIGLVYAISASLMILVIDRAPHGAEHIKEILTGDLLWVSWRTIGLAALVYSGVGLLHYLCRGPLMRITDDLPAARAAGLPIRLWDFFFYATFGVVITHSVRVAGVLLVFVFLIAPAIFSMMFTDKWRHQVIVGWSLGTVVTTLGMAASYGFDLPVGPTVVACYGIVLLAGGGARSALRLR